MKLYRVLVQKPTPRRQDPLRHRRVIIVMAKTAKQAETLALASYDGPMEGVLEVVPLRTRTITLMP